MTFVGMTWPLFGPSIKAALSFQVQHDVAAMMSRESGIPFGRIGGLSGDANEAKNTVHSICIRSIGCYQSECGRNNNRGEKLPIPDPLTNISCRIVDGEECCHYRLPDDSEYEGENYTIECAGFGVRRKRVKDRCGHESG